MPAPTLKYAVSPLWMAVRMLMLNWLSRLKEPSAPNLSCHQPEWRPALQPGQHHPSHGPLEEDVAGARPQEAAEKPGGILGAFGAARRIGRFARRPDGARIGTVMMDAFNITQDRISRSRLAGDPPT